MASKKKDLQKKIIRLTRGAIFSLTDLVLWQIFFLLEISPMGEPTNIRKAEFLANKDLDQFNSRTLKEAIYRARKRGWIKEDLTLTKEGIQRLEGFIPKRFQEKKWDGNWYLASYDVPEKKRLFRNIFRENLKKLGFGELHASLWVCPFNFLAEVEKLVKEYNLSPYVILAISNKLGREESKYLANKIWKLEQINSEYKKLIQKTKTAPVSDSFFDYLAILRKDPQLPAELLPKGWLGEEAHLTFKNYLPR